VERAWASSAGDHGTGRPGAPLGGVRGEAARAADGMRRSGDRRWTTGTAAAGKAPASAVGAKPGKGPDLAAGTVTCVDQPRMNMPSRCLYSAVLAIFLAPAVGLAQTAAGSTSTPPAAAGPAASPPASPGSPTAAAPEMSAATRTAVDQRIRTLQSQLGITQAEMPLWSAFAQAMRDNAASTDALFARRADAVAEMSAVDNMHSYAQIARNYADNTERLATAFDSLYASLSDVQKHAADNLFRQQAVAAARSRPRR